MAPKVRPNGKGGWLCESGTAWLVGNTRHRPDPTKVCNADATRIMAGYDPKNPPPGTVCCEYHAAQPSVGHAIWVVLPVSEG